MICSRGRHGEMCWKDVRCLRHHYPSRDRISESREVDGRLIEDSNSLYRQTVLFLSQQARDSLYEPPHFQNRKRSCSATASFQTYSSFQLKPTSISFTGRQCITGLKTQPQMGDECKTIGLKTLVVMNVLNCLYQKNLHGHLLYLYVDII